LNWFNETNIRGPTGATGATGPPGPGLNLLGTVPTPGALPPTGNADGDAYNCVSDGHLYVWDGDSWVDGGQFKGDTGATGPQGPTGATGAASTVPGPTGPTGATGATGATGPAGAPGVATYASTAPASPVTGQLWYNSTSGQKTLSIWTGAAWEKIDAVWA